MVRGDLLSGGPFGPNPNLPLRRPGRYPVTRWPGLRRLAANFERCRGRKMSSTSRVSESAPTPLLKGPQSDARLFDGYECHATAWDELFVRPGEPHEAVAALMARLGELTTAEFQQLRASADLVFINQGITFSVYADRRGVEKIFPFDLIPRPVSAARVEDAGSGAAPADPGAEPVPVRRLSRPADPARRGRSRRTWCCSRSATAPRWSGSSRRASSISTWSAPT